MTPLIAVELICSVFVAVLVIRQFREYDGSGSSGWLLLNSVAMLVWLLVDALAGLTGLEYILTLLAYVLGSVVLYFSCGYFDAYVSQRTPLNPWIFRVPRIIALLCAAAAAAEFVSGRIVEYVNGVPVAVNAVPVCFPVIQICTISFSLAVAFRKRKALGRKAVSLFCLFSVSTIAGIVTAPFLRSDYTLVFCAVSLMIIVTFLQKHKTGLHLENTFAGISVIIILYMILQSGAFSKDPVVEVKPDNCYEETLHVVTDEDYLPYSFYDSDGNESGHDVELITMLANEMRMNLDLRFVPWSTGIRELAEGKAEVLLTCDYNDDLGGVDGLRMTEPISTDDFVVYSRKTVRHIDELYDRKIAVMESANCLPYIEMYHLEDRCVFTDSNSSALKAVENGTADCAIVRYTVAEAILKESGYTDISGSITVGSSFTCFGIGQDNKDLQERLNAAIETLKLNGELQRLDEKWLTTFVHTYSLREILSNNPRLAVYIAASILAALLAYMHAKKKRAAAEAANNARLFTLEDNFESLYDVELESGSYVSFVKGDFYQKTVTERLVTPTDYFENLRGNIDAVIYSEDRDGLYGVLTRDSIRRELAENEHFDYFYRLNTEKGPAWFRMRLVWKDAAKKNVIIGVFNAGEEMAAREQAERRRTELLASLAGNVSSYIINTRTNRFQIFRQAEYLTGRYTPDEDFTASIGRYIDTDVYPPDREMMRKAMNIPALTAALEKENEYSLAFRDISSGNPRWYEMRAARLSEEEIFMGFSDINETYTVQMIFGKMKQDYFALVYLYLDSGTAHAVKDDPGLLIGKGHTIPYPEMIGKIITTMSGEAKEYFERLGDTGYLKEKFRKEDKAEYIFISDYSGEEHWINLTQLVLERDRGGEPLVVAFGFRFLDEETKNVQELQMKIAEQQKQLEEALSMADAANKAKTDFLFNMSHDIRTPMNAIIGFTGIAKKEIDNREKALDSLDKVQISSEILLNLINDVLDMSRIESGKVELHEEKFEFTKAFDSFRPAMASLAASKDIDLTFRIGDIRNRYIFVDGPRFDRVMINIISNAIKYTLPEGSVTVEAEQIPDTRPGYGNYRFTVADSGIGMSEEFQKHMFEDFTREENSITIGIQGTGLGLALAKRLVDLMSGTISCKSAQGVGTTFTIEFPFRLQTEEDISEEAAEVQDYHELDLRGKKALLVDDNELNREIAGDILSEEGIIVETAADGQEAVSKVLERGDNYYEFILMDIQMPVMNGYEATRRIHMLMPGLRAPIIALSANAFAEDRKKSLEAGMDDHVAKPINIRELFGALAKFL